MFTNWEYIVEQYFNVQNPETLKIKMAAELLKDDLPQKGLQGWELVSLVNQMGGELLAVYKRPQNPFKVEVAGQFPQPQPKPVFMDPNVPVNDTETTGPLKKPFYTLDVTSGPGPGVRFPVPVAPTPVQRDFPSRDFSSGFQRNPNDPE